VTPRISFYSEGRWSDYHPFPYLDVIELSDGYLVQVELAGVDPNAVSVRVVGDALVIEGERKPRYPDGALKVLRMELVYGRFRRELLLPVDADPAGITARWSQGVLRVRVPRLTKSYNVDIEVED
jgi:HSP20 family protein